MGVSVAPENWKRNRDRLRAPLERSAAVGAHVAGDDHPENPKSSAGVYAQAVAAQRQGRDLPAAPPELFAPELAWNWEVARAHAAGLAMELFLNRLCARDRIVIYAAVARVIELLSLWVCAELLARLRWPDDYAVVGPDGEPLEPPAEEPTISESYALAMNLTIQRPVRTREKKRYILPGCQWDRMCGKRGTRPCQMFRAAGDRLCPKHAKLYLARHRPEQEE